MSIKHFLSLGIAAAVVMSITVSAQADPYPDQILKFQQLPMIATPIAGSDGTTNTYFGHDEFSTAYGSHANGVYTSGQYMADDFADNFDTPVVHIRWWGSYMGPIDPGFPGVRRFLIAWETDVPAGDPNNPVPYSHPGQLIQGEVVDRTAAGAPPPAGFFTETLVPGSNPVEPVYEYNAELFCPFEQQADTVYWLKIVALVDPSTDGGIEWGWHNRDYTIMDPLASPVPVPGEHVQGTLPDGSPIWHFQDDAVTGPIVIQLNPTDPWHPLVDQPVWSPTNYIDGLDGPGPDAAGIFPGIGAFSKDLAFELYTIPEPATLALLGIGSLMMIRRRS